MKANIWIEQIGKIVSILVTTLATENILNLKIRNYHWNVKGLNFSDHHKFFEDLYNESSENIDEIAERIRMLGEFTPANYETYLKESIINEEKWENVSAGKMMEALLADKETIIRQMRADIDTVGELGDVGTEDFLTGLIQKHEKNAWMLRSMIS